MANKWTKRLKKLGIFQSLSREAGLAPALKWLVFSALKIEKPLFVQVRGVAVEMRTAGSDANVILDSLCGEFDEVVAEISTAKHGLIVDGGGYIGTAAIIFAKQYPEATIVTIEPSAANFALLQKNVAAYPNIVPMNRALDSKPGVLRMYDHGTGAWGFSAIKPKNTDEGGVLNEIECITIPDILAETGKQGIDILKVDIEGGELSLLSGDLAWLDSTDAMVIELHDRIVSGCTEAYEAATSGRENRAMKGEKFLSLRTG